MGLGILEPKSGEHVPGTTRLKYFDDSNNQTEASGNEAPPLKCQNGIILIPQPSDDPNDPLNWPLWRRDLITFTLCFAGILATSLGSILASNTLVLSLVFTVPLTQTAVLTGYFLLGAGAAAMFFVPSGRVWGKRHLFLLGMLIIVISSAWAGSSGENYNSMAAARAFQGIGAAPFESLLNAAVGDLYFVHQRGMRMAFTNLAVFGGAFFTPVIVGKITASMGWDWSFYFVSIFMAATLPAVFFLCPETAYRRETRLDIDGTIEEVKLNPGPNSASSSSPADADALAAAARPTGLGAHASELQPIGDANTPKKTFLQSLALFDGRKTHERYWKLLLRPFPLLMNPAFVWGCLIQGTMIGWTVFIGVLIAIVFVGPPYFWGELKAGYTYTAPFIGAIIGFVIAGLLADTSVRLLTRLNRGIYEPEFRILLVIPMLITGGIGLYGFGISADDIISGKFEYIVPLIFFAFEVMGMVIGTVASSLYIVDAYRNMTVEGFTLMIIFKNIFSFILTWYAYDWLIQSGIKFVFIIISSVQVGVCLLSIPMYIYGKRIRAFYHRHDPLAMAGLR
ncbi:Major facilitator superfamily domain, general substrate transporter [Drechmeria coniospora]|uniref:Major facilitator superfamily domain, general substrate transporter n=1 Tax=Drechmeria coniospora TaxID=98403 RepID=A0A151GIH4_DRECN|nr:Major facilitator superfamily domain, general substrate transporter [Drechmeria coniospora]KYK56897.1 Major facilitator superfamily domain, general substrate transporter [Drechmeria coniospora]